MDIKDKESWTLRVIRNNSQCFKAFRTAAMLAVALAAVFALSSCSSDSPTVPKLQKISDVGTLVEIHTYPDGIIPEYEYKGVNYWGDILLADVDKAMNVLMPNFSEFEVLISVINYREFPESQQGLSAPGYLFRMNTCTADPMNACDSGGFYLMKEVNETVEVEYSGIWIL